MLYKFKRSKMIARRADLHRRIELEDDGDLRSPGESIAPCPAAPAIVSRGRAICSQWQNDRRRAGAARSHLRALERNDDPENAFQYFRPPDHRSTGALDFFCWLRRSGIARGRICARPSLTNLFRSTKMSRRSRCAARSNSSSSARTLRANRSSTTSGKSRRRKWCWCTEMSPAVEWMRASAAAALPGSEDHRAAAGSGDRLCSMAARLIVRSHPGTSTRSANGRSGCSPGCARRARTSSACRKPNAPTSNFRPRLCVMPATRRSFTVRSRTTASPFWRRKSRARCGWDFATRSRTTRRGSSLPVSATVRVISIYAPNGQAVGSAAYQYKMEWYRRLTNCLREMEGALERVVVCGDFNVAPNDEDVHDPALWRGAIMCSEEERAAFRGLRSDWAGGYSPVASSGAGNF